MEITSEQVQNVTVITLKGDIDGKTAGTTQQTVLPMIPSNGRLLLDMSAVPYMSSAGLRMLLLIYRQAQSKHSEVALVGLTDDIKDTMSATGFLSYFLTAADVTDGVKSFSA
ncbi:STAS domain-containing protein (plasmid) [Deinococcus sp. KNUC1210]|uniref:STAS domain-containing protein n=1 Tax=Deinococcus sp. KNUC1210 TaxID=2917691 RepID=UPI001EF13C6F|nr:STAS domain-containing protein [Deinococcus sp. KNUC1210]ULH17773.1 STAS domain-containing protein [Deinococcus sp. KNUC1210]